MKFKKAKRCFLLILPVIGVFSLFTMEQSFAQNPSKKPPINKQQSKSASLKQLFKGAKFNKRKKKQGTQISNSFSGGNISKSGPTNKSKQGKALESNKMLSSKVSKNRGANQSRKSLSYSGGQGKKKGLSKLFGGSATEVNVGFVSPHKKRRRKLSARSLSFSGENISKPSEGQLARKDRIMNKKARKGMYVNHTKNRKLRSNLSYTSLSFSGRPTELGKKKKSNTRDTSTRIKIRTRPVANKMVGKRGQRLPRTSKKRKAKLKYDKKERKIWAR